MGIKTKTKTMEISGLIVAILPLQTGEGKNGTWTKQTAVLETAGQYPKKVAFDMFGDKIKELKIGDVVNVKFDIDSREFNGKWYTNIGAWAVETGVNVPSVPKDEQTDTQLPEDDGLPFH